ncbi:MAG: type II toxin-antitoxin system RelE/ParE family toxin [Oscillospiraceae bacterium]|nr:type II toxin-antitoxin system RelE/ParE family toxin [Oscillospiraceae bacterium]
MEVKKYLVSVTPPADQRFANHIAFLARVSERAAMGLYQEYEEAFGFLEEAPESCPLYTTSILVDATLRYKLFGKRYRIVFEVVDNAVCIYDIQDCRQDTNKNLI